MNEIEGRMKRIGFIGVCLLGSLALPALLRAAQGKSVDDVGQIVHSFEGKAAALQRVAVRYHIEVAQKMPAEEIGARTSEMLGRLGLQGPPGRIVPLPVLVECVWARANGVEYLETTEHNVGGQVRHQKRLVAAEKTIRWQAPDNLWDPRLKGDFARVLITTNRGAGWVPGYRFARFYAEDEHGRPLTESLRSADWNSAGLDTTNGKRIHKLRRIQASSANSYTEAGFDEDRGFSIISRTIIMDGRTNLHWVVEDSREVAPGVWLPVRIAKQNFWRDTGEPLDVSKITVDDIKVNERVPANALELQWERGSSVVDEIKRIKYREGLTAPEPTGN